MNTLSDQRWGRVPESNENVRFELLGSVRVYIGANQIAMPERERTLLAALLLSANELVDRSRLVDAIWGERPPYDARSQLHGCVSRLRKRLAAAGVARQMIVTHAAGYEIEVPLEQVDLWRFRGEVGRARTAVEQVDYSVAVVTYRAALSLWRGPALAGLDSHLLQQAAEALDEERVRVTEERIDLELSQGAAGELVPELTELVSQYPYRERLHAARMLALYQDGRRADALSAYQRVRRLLVDEVGTEPGSLLRKLQQRILKDEQPPSPPTETRLLNGTSLGVRRCLPRSVGDFTGRVDSVARLIEMATETSTAPTVIAIDGMAGIGKTALAVHVAHLLAERYPDTQLFIDLQGYGEKRPMEPAAALEKLLRQLGVSGGRIPPGLEDRVSLWRSELADKRVLVLLDNAASTNQVAALLPGKAGNLTLITSRRRLTGLDGVRPLSLDLLTTDEAVSLFTGIAGERVRREPKSATEVVRRCGNLPLAIRLVAARLAHRPNWRVWDLADRLSETREVLAELAVEDRSVADAFALSYSQLGPDHQRVFRLLGLLSGESFDVLVVAALADIPIVAARQIIEDLVDRHLIEEPAPGRYRLHDLVRYYAYRLASTIDSGVTRKTAKERLLSFYLHAAVRTSAPLLGWTSGRAFDPGETARAELVLAASQNNAWLEIERSNLVAAVRDAVACGLDHYAWRLARACWAFFYYRGYTDDLKNTHHCGLAAAERLGANDAIAMMCNYLASAYYKVGKLDHAASLISRALAIRLESDELEGAAIARMNLAMIQRKLGNLNCSTKLFREALADQQRVDDTRGIANTLQNAGIVYTELGRYDEAARFLRRRLTMSRELWGLAGVANPLGGLGAIRLRLGQHDIALRLLTVALWLHRRIGNREGEMVVGNELAVLHRKLGGWDEAVARHTAALSIAEEVGDWPGACVVRNDLGQTLRLIGSVADALKEHRAVLATATRIRLRFERARALDGIAACLVPGDPAEACRHWEKALVLYREMGVPEQAEVERHLATVSAQSLGMRDLGGLGAILHTD